MKKIISTLTASLLLSFFGMTQPATGLHFDGANDYVSCGNILTPSYTKEAWINISNTLFINNIISGGSADQHAFWAPNSESSRLSSGHNSTYNSAQDPASLSASTWYHVAVTYDAATTTMKLYKNGALVSTNTTVPPVASGNGVSIGAYDNTFVFFGLIDEVRIWNRALCQDEIQHNMNCGLNPAGQNGLVALYHFDQGTVGANNAGITTLIDASGNGNHGTLNNFALTGATSNWAAGTISGTCSPPAFAPTVMAGTPGGGTVSSTMTVSPSGTYFTNNCELINRVLPSGATPVTGSITSKVTIDATVQSYGGSPYVQRHYDIEPATDPNGDATITLYYTQAEFTSYNTARGGPPFLPMSGADPEGYKTNLRITQYHGTGTAPGNYTGSAFFIDPVDGNIVWNGVLSRWEVTFDVTSFSGFYANTSPGVLPVNLLSFSGISSGLHNKMQWVTASEQNSDYFDLERSTDGITFSKTATLQAQNNSNNNYYTYNDLRGTSNIYYYRLKMVEKDGAFKYSAILRISSKQTSIISVYPNPAKETITVSVSDTKLFKTDIRLTDMNGRLIQIVNLNNLQQPVDIARLNPGTYIIQFADGSVTKFVKQ